MNQSETTSAAGGGETFAALRDARLWVEHAIAPLRGLSPVACEPGEALLKRIDAALAAPTAKGGTEGMRAALAPFADAWRACMELGDQGAGYVQDNQDALVSGNKSGGAHPLFKFGDLRRAAEALASPPPPAGAAGGGSGDLGTLSAEAVAAAYYDCMIGDPKEFWPHHDGWAGKSEAFKAKVRDRMAKALKIAALSAPTPDLGAQGEPVAKHHGAAVIAGLAELIPLIDDLGAVAMGFVQSEPTPEKAKLLMGSIDRLLDKRDTLDFDAAPAAFRTGPSASDLIKAIHDNVSAVTAAGGESFVDYAQVQEVITALFAQAPRDGGETQGGWQPIETAPKNGAWIEAWIPKKTPEDDADFAIGGVDSVRWSGKEFWWSRHVGCSYPAACPTHWRPLPTPPSGVETIRQDTSGGV